MSEHNEAEGSIPTEEASTTAAAPVLSAPLKAKIERNRQRALLLKQARQAARPYTVEKTPAVVTASAPTDSGAGFFVEEEVVAPRPVVHQEPPSLGTEQLKCQDCGRKFTKSYLNDNFDALICDSCKDMEDKHKLITKSDAKDLYLLKDSDFTSREPPLRFMSKKNPHNDRWGTMKLYLGSQVYERALEVWGSEEQIDEQKQLRADNRDKVKQKRFDKKVKELRKAVGAALGLRI